MRNLRIHLLLLAGVLLTSPVHAGEETPTEAPGFWTKALWYIPNRVLDVLDLVRLRAGVGPGIEAGLRVTDAATLYGGESRTVWVGLPGERPPGGLPRFAGASQKDGLVLLGVDASDVQPDPPRYEPSEIGVQLHLGVAGVEAGIVPSELIDLVYGFFGADVSGDDLPRQRPKRPREPGRMLGMAHEEAVFPLEDRPEQFQGLGERLDYLQANVPLRMRGYMHHVDRAFLEDHEARLQQPPVTELEIGLWLETITGEGENVDLDRKFRLDVELPNLERNFSLFIDSDYNENLPGADSRDIEDSGIRLGLRQQMRKWNISGDVGVKTKWPPEAFARLRWRPDWNWGETRMSFEQRLFWENEDGFGLLTQLRGYRWLGDTDHWLFRNTTAGRFSESTEGLEWEQTFTLGHMTHLVEEERRLSDLGPQHTLNCVAWKASVFGKDRELDKYRTTLLYRRPVYKDFVLTEIEPGLEWRSEDGWEIRYRFDVGMVLLF
jgi:hypothetical protein